MRRQGGGTGWNWLEPAAAGCGRTGLPLAKSESADRVRSGLPWNPGPLSGGLGLTRAPERRPVAARGLQPQAPWAALRPQPRVLAGGAVRTGGASGTIVTRAAGRVQGPGVVCGSPGPPFSSACTVFYEFSKC